MRHPRVAKNGLPRMMGICVSSYISTIIKSISTYKSHTFIGTSSKIPIWYFTERSTNCKEMVISLISPSSHFLHIERGIKLALDPKSHKAWPMGILCIRQVTEKLARSFDLAGSLFWITVLHYSFKATISCSSSFLLLDRISFKNLACEGIGVRALVNRICYVDFINDF